MLDKRIKNLLDEMSKQDVPKDKDYALTLLALIRKYKKRNTAFRENVRGAAKYSGISHTTIYEYQDEASTKEFENSISEEDIKLLDDVIDSIVKKAKIKRELSK